MSSPIISVENLSKSYLVGHQAARQERYTALRDVLGRSAKNFTRKAWDMVRGRQIIQGDEVEEFWALKDVSFEVNEGEVMGIIGRNGAGKSTLLKVMSRITEPTCGRVTLRGRVASLLEVGTGFHPELTGRENIFLNGAILGMTRTEIRRKFDEIVDFAGVERFLDTPVKRYSSGMYVRLAFAVAAHLEPEILVIDEVLAVGDAEFQKKCLGKMKHVAQAGRTVLFVSHNMGAITSLCSSAILLADGLAHRYNTAQQAVTKHLESSSTFSAKEECKSREISTSLRLLDFQLSPSNPESGDAVELTFTLLALDNLELTDLSILLYTTDGIRLSIFDLRNELLPVSLPLNRNWEVRCKLDSLPLVQGEYSLGLYVRTCECVAELRNVSTFNVLPKISNGRSTPYPSEHLGYLTLEFSASVSGVNAHEVA